MLGTQRVGPDLANAGFAWISERFCFISTILVIPPAAPGTMMPPYPYLFRKQKIDRTPSPDALPISTESGYEIVPTTDGQNLATYVASLRQTAYIFEFPPPASDKPITMHPATDSPATQCPQNEPNDKQNLRRDNEPNVGNSSVPMWLILLLGLFFYWGHVSDENAGGLMRRVYHPFENFTDVDDAQPEGRER